MPIYLAYQFEPEELTKTRLVRLMEDYYDFNPKSSCSDVESWFKYVDQEIKRIRGQNAERAERLEKMSPFEKAGYFAPHFTVKNHPLLEIYTRFQNPKFAYCPENFTGLNIWAGHSGSEGLIDLLEFKPEMDAFLSIIGINYEDKSKVHL